MSSKGNCNIDTLFITYRHHIVHEVMQDLFSSHLWIEVGQPYIEAELEMGIP